jgi:hypothetical protein
MHTIHKSTINYTETGHPDTLQNDYEGTLPLKYVQTRKGRIHVQLHS